MAKDKNSNTSDESKDSVATGSGPDSGKEAQSSKLKAESEDEWPGTDDEGEDLLEGELKGILDRKVNYGPAFLEKLSKSELDKPPESGDIIYLKGDEINLEDEIHTIRTVLVPDNEANWQNHKGPWIERCMGRDPEKKKLMVARIPAKEKKVSPLEVVQYLGSVVQDRQSVHTDTIVHPGKNRHGYVFDHFFYFNGKKEPRCCWIPSRVHLAGLIFEKQVDKVKRTSFARIRRIKGHLGRDTGEPMYKIFGAKETDYRDLKRIFERHFLNRGPEELADDIGLKKLLG